LSIGHGQTISQPFIVALMTDLLDLEPESRVLEIGTGSGYQAAVLAEMGMRVNSVEILEPLARKAAAALAQAGYGEVALRVGDGCSGWPERAPFDGIVVTAAPLRVPRELARQLAPGGRLVIPVGRSGGYQELMRGEMGRDGKLHRARVLPVAFVPCTGDAGCGAVSG
jgi:protein-L-isoaspartate(D-aspartate) O-methyltransferase